MDPKYLFRVSGVLLIGILCNGDLLMNKTSSHLNAEIRDFNSERIRELWQSRDLISRMLLERNERAVNRSDPDAAPRVAETDDPKNSSSASLNKTIVEHALLVAEFKRLWPVWRWRQYGYFSDDYLDLISEHWLQYPPPSEAVQKTLGGMYLLFATAGCWGNVVVLFMYLRLVIEFNLC